VDGQKLTLLAFVRTPANVPNPPMPGGTVNFLDGTTLLGSATLNSAGAAAIILPVAAETHSLTVSYLGDALCKTSTLATAVTQTVASLVTGIVSAPAGKSQTTHTFKITAQASSGPAFLGSLTYSDPAKPVSLTSVVISTLVMSSSNTHATIAGTAKLSGVSGYRFTLDVDIWNGSNAAVSHAFTITITGPGGYSYSYTGDMDTGSAVSFTPTTKSAATPAVRSASTAARTDAALASILAQPIRSRVRVKLGR
jgi:hypothetical protein